MLTKEQNDLVTRVCGDAPMGRMLKQHFWIPAALSQKLEADGTPLRVRLFGEDYVAFRATDGRVGFFDEACPHRGVSLALARNEDNALRCIFHGWKFGVTGETLEVPTQPNNEREFCKRVPLNHYPVREAAGIVWVWLGDGGTAPAFQELEFTRYSAPRQVFPTVHVGRFNWLQAVETTLDSAHLGVLHQSSMAGVGDIERTKDNLAPTYELEPQPYGFRYASLRPLKNDLTYVRLNSFVAPWFAVIAPANARDSGGTVQFSVPIDDETSAFWVVPFHPTRDAAQETPVIGCEDPADWPPPVPGGPDTNWGQDREAMKRGHFSGFPQSLFTEDMAVITSMKPIVDRSKEFLNLADTAVVRVRRTLLQAVQEFIAGETPECARHAEIDYPTLRAEADLIPTGSPWRDHIGGNAAPAPLEHAGG